MSFTIRTPVPALTHQLDLAYGDLPDAQGPAVEVDLLAVDGEITVFAEDRTYYRGTEPGVAFANLASAVNQEAVRASGHLLLVHAGGVERDGRAVVLPAAPGAGKSTLVAGLVARGFRLLTDEVVAIDPMTGQVWPYPRPIALKPGSWPVLPGLAPEVGPDVKPYLTELWLVPPSRIRADSIGGISRPALVVLPQYVSGATTACRPLPRAAALEALAGSCFNLGRWGRTGFLAMGDVVRSSSCHRLTIGSLDEACGAVERLFEAPGGPA